MGIHVLAMMLCCCIQATGSSVSSMKQWSSSIFLGPTRSSGGSHRILGCPTMHFYQVRSGGGGVEPENLPLRFKYYEGVHARFLCKSSIVYLSFDRTPSVSTRPFISIIALLLIPFRGALAFDISRSDNVSRNLNPCIPPG